MDFRGCRSLVPLELARRNLSSLHIDIYCVLLRNVQDYDQQRWELFRSQIHMPHACRRGRSEAFLLSWYICRTTLTFWNGTCPQLHGFIATFDLTFKTTSQLSSRIFC